MVADDVLMRAFIVDALGVTSDVAEARDAASCLEMLAGPGSGFDVVVADHLGSTKSPPRFGCVALVRTIFLRWPWIPIVIVSSEQDTEQLVADVLLTGVRCVLRPPLLASDLSASIGRVVRAPGTGRPGAPATIVRLKRILAFLGEQIGEIPNLGELAAMASMSPSHFSHMFHAIAGRPLRDYLRELRLKQAHHLLVSSSLSLTMVAVESGFYDLPHFDKAFRQRFGMSPHRFRSLHARPLQRRA